MSSALARLLAAAVEYGRVRGADPTDESARAAWVLHDAARDPALAADVRAIREAVQHLAIQLRASGFDVARAERMCEDDHLVELDHKDEQELGELILTAYTVLDQLRAKLGEPGE